MAKMSQDQAEVPGPIQEVSQQLEEDSEQIVGLPEPNESVLLKPIDTAMRKVIKPVQEEAPAQIIEEEVVAPAAPEMQIVEELVTANLDSV